MRETIGNLLYDYGEKFILSALEEGEYSIAVEKHLHMLDSLTHPFITDEHWCWFDDFYSPDYTLSSIWEQFVPHIRLGKLHGEDLKTLEDGLALIVQTEAYQNYGIPSGIPFKNLIGNDIPIFRKPSSRLLAQ